MNFREIRIITIGSALLTTSLLSFGQSRLEKTDTIFRKLKLIESQKMKYEFQIDYLKFQATGNDSIKIIELEKQLSNDEIVKRINSAFNEVFSDNEISEIYEFIQTSAFEKLFNSGEIYKIIATKFTDLDKEIEVMTTNFSNVVEKPRKKFSPIPVKKKNGFYATVDYNFSIEEKDIKLEEAPSLTSKDISEIKKVYNKYNGNRPEISIVLTKEGAQKFYLFTKENIAKTIAIVIDNHIVSMPVVQSEIMGGRVSISGEFSEKEIDRMIKELKGK